MRFVQKGLFVGMFPGRTTIHTDMKIDNRIEQRTEEEITMKIDAEERVIRYLRHVLQGHPRSGQQYVDGLVAKGMTHAEVVSGVLIPARARIADLRKAHYVNAIDAKNALSVTNQAIARLSPAQKAYRVTSPTAVSAAM